MNILLLMAAMCMNLSRKPKKNYFRLRMGKSAGEYFNKKGGVK